MRIRRKIKNRTIRHTRSGLCLIEVLLALAIMALLLGATAVAFDAALRSYKVNHDLASISVSARNAIYQMTTTIRSAWNDPDGDMIEVTDGGTQCSMVDAWGRSVGYRYNKIDCELQATIDGGTHWYVMVENVHPISVGEPIFIATDPEGGDFQVGTVGRVEIRFMVSQDGVSRTFSASAVPRNVLYGM